MRETAVVRKSSTRDLDQITVFCCTPHSTHNFGIMLGTVKAKVLLLTSIFSLLSFKNFIYFLTFFFFEKDRDDDVEDIADNNVADEIFLFTYFLLLLLPERRWKKFMLK